MVFWKSVPRGLPALLLLLAFALAGCVTAGKQPAATTAARPATAPADPPEEPPFRVRLSLDETSAELLGEITLVSAYKLDALLLGNPSVRTLRLTSPGGTLGPALVLAERVAERGMTVYVPLYCASACALIFAAGERRLLAPGARLGYHSASGSLGDQRMAEALAGYGLPAAFIARIQATPHRDSWHPTLAELKAAGAITGVASEAAPPKLAGDPLELAGWASGQEALMQAYGAAFPAREAPLRAATLAFLRGEPAAEAELEALALRMQVDLTQALPRTGHAALRAFFGLMRDALATLRDTAPDLCATGAGAAADALDPGVDDQRARQGVTALTLVFRSYAAAPAELDRARAMQGIQDLLRGLFDKGVLRASDAVVLAKPASNFKRHCDVMVAVLDAAISAPGPEALRGLAIGIAEEAR